MGQKIIFDNVDRFSMGGTALGGGFVAGFIAG
jgi:hypothetical protein